jgi:hypothetical protein
VGLRDRSFDALHHLAASSSRTVGTGASDSVALNAILTWEEAIEDAQTVLDAVGSEHPVIYAEADAGPIADKASASLRPSASVGVAVRPRGSVSSTVTPRLPAQRRTQIIKRATSPRPPRGISTYWSWLIRRESGRRGSWWSRAGRLSRRPNRPSRRAA